MVGTGTSASPEPGVTDARAHVEAARVAAGDHRWADAFAAFGLADEAGVLDRDDLDSYGNAAWWTGQLTTAIRVRERAFGGHVKADDRRRAARTALALANDYGHRLQHSLAAGWVKRAERLLDADPDAPEHALLARARLNAALSRGKLDEALAQAETVLEIGRRVADHDIYALGVHDKGRVLVARGDVEEGLALLDEAVVAAISDELSPLVTAIVYCNSTVACQDLADYRRAAEFADAAREWCDRQAISGFPGMCRVRRAEVTRLRGAWGEAENEARQACAELQDFCLDYAGEGFYQIGEIRLRMGDLEAADEAFRRAHELGRDPIPGLALLRAAQGKPAAGLALLKRAVSAPTTSRLHRTRLLVGLVEVAITVGDVAEAAASADELRAIANEFGTHALLASSAVADGMVALRRGDPEDALAALERGRRLWQETDAPYEVAQTRALIGEAHRLIGDVDAADLEFQAARSTFERLGARPDLDRLEEIERTATQPARPVRVHRAMMFTDIERSTDLIDAIGDDAWAGLLEWHDRTIRALIRAHRGEEIDHAGDGFFVVFATADDAIDTATEIQRRLAEHRREHGFAPRVRIGLHTGQAIHLGRSYEGREVHAAARIGALAEGDEILASADVIAAASRPRRTEPRGQVTLKGIRRAVEVVKVVGDAR